MSARSLVVLAVGVASAAVACEAVAALQGDLAQICAAAGVGAGAQLWGVPLGPTTNELDTRRQRALLAAFLVARDGDAIAARAMLEATVNFRAHSAHAARLASAATTTTAGAGRVRLPTDLLQRQGKRGAKPTIVISAAKLEPSAFSEPDAFVDWWVTMQARPVSAHRPSSFCDPRVFMFITIHESRRP